MRALALVPLAACASGDPVLYNVPVAADPVAGARWTAADGATLALSEASVTFADLRLEAPGDLGGLLPAASAHPGVDGAGPTQGELLGTWTLDLLAGPAQLGVASCYLGDYATGRLRLTGATTLRGTATPAGGDAVDFAFDLELDEEIPGIPFAAALTTDSVITLSIDAAGLLGHVDWLTAPAGASLALTDGALAQTVPFGVRSTLSWRLTAAP